MVALQLQSQRFRPVSFVATTLNGKILASVELGNRVGQVGVQIDSLWGLISAVDQLSKARHGRSAATGSRSKSDAAGPPPRYLEVQLHNLTVFARLGAKLVFAALCETATTSASGAGTRDGEQHPLTMLSIRGLLDWSTLTLLHAHAALVERLIAEQEELRENFRGYSASDVAGGRSSKD